MINTSEEFKRTLLDTRKYMYSAKLYLKDGTELSLNNSNVMEGTVQFEQATSNMGSFDLGAATCNTHSLALINMMDEFSQYDFADAIIVPKIGLQLTENVEYLNKGYFFVDEAKYNGATISLSALDEMSLLDRPYAESKLQYPASLLQIYRDACTSCGIYPGNARFDHDNYMVKKRPSEEAVTFRDVISYIAQIAGYYAIMDTERKLCLKWYDLKAFEGEDALNGGQFDPYKPEKYTTGDAADGGDFRDYSADTIYDGGTFQGMGKYHHIYRLSSQNINTDDVMITGVKITVIEDGEEEEKTFLAGDDGYTINIENNPLVAAADIASIAEWLFAKIGGMRFRPLTVSALSDPSVEAGDAVYISDRKGNSYATYLTSVSFTMGGYETYTCDAETVSEKQSVSYSPAAKAAVAARKHADQMLSDYDIAMQRLTDLMTHSLGAYKTEVTDDETGAKIYYMHNKPKLEESDKIWKSTADAFVVSSDGGKTWNGGMDADGNAVVNLLSAIGIVADWIQAGMLRDKTGKSFWNLDTGELSLSGVFSQFNYDGMKSMEIRNNQVIAYDWNGDGAEVGALGALKSNADNPYRPNNSAGLGVWGKNNGWLTFGIDSEDGTQVTSHITIDNKHDTPQISGTAGGTIKLPGGGTINVENGLITGWSIPATPSDTMTIPGGGKIVIKNGVVSSWTIPGMTDGTVKIGVDGKTNTISVTKGVITKWDTWY